MIDEDGYRPNVASVIINKDNKFKTNPKNL